MNQFRTMRKANPKKMAKKNRYYYWDIESWGLNPRNVAFIIVKPEQKYTRDTPDEWLFHNHAHMRSWLESLPKTKNHIFYAHNGNKFDILSIYSAQEIIDSEKLMSGSSYYTIRPKKNLEFRDSYHLLNAPLRNYGAKGITPDKFINENNPDFGNNNSITDSDIDYCRLDVDILREAIVTLRASYCEWVGRNNADLPLTSSSLAFRVWCHNYWPEEWSYEGKTGKTYYSVTFPDRANECAKFAYYGGRVQVFEGFEGLLVYLVMSGDRNSMFPSEMRDQIFPDPNHVYSASPSISRLMRARDSGMPYWGKFILKAGKDAKLFLPKIIKGKTDYNTKYFDGFLMYPEVNHALESGWELLEVQELWVSKPCNHFSNYVNYFYSERMKLKAVGDSRQLFYKLLLNQLYGKFGQKDKCDRVEDKEGIRKIMEDDDWREKWEVHEWNKESTDFYLVEKEPSIVSRNTFFPWSASITSYARVSLQKAKETVENAGYEVVYCDTDSLHIHNIDDLDNIPLDIGKNLGQWGWEFAKGHEGIIPSAKYWERKAYVWYGDNGEELKIKHKGVSDSDGDLTKAQFNRSVIQPRTAKRRGLESGYEIIVEKRSKKWYNGERKS